MRYTLVLLSLALLLPHTAAGSSRGTPTRFALVVHVARGRAGAVLSERRLQEWLKRANKHFRPAGIELVGHTRELPHGWEELPRIRDRHRLKRFLVPRQINVFVVGRILDPVASATTRRAAKKAGFEPSGRLAGAHIVALGHRPGTYVILSAEHGSALSFTHELGHFFGVAHHGDPQNIMSYGSKRARFDARQLATFRRRARRYRRGRELVTRPLPEPATVPNDMPSTPR